MTDAQAKRLASFRKRVSVKGAVETDSGTVVIGWERSRDGRDMTTELDSAGRTIRTETTYRH